MQIKLAHSQVKHRLLTGVDRGEIQKLVPPSSKINCDGICWQVTLENKYGPLSDFRKD